MTESKTTCPLLGDIFSQNQCVRTTTEIGMCGSCLVSHNYISFKLSNTGSVDTNVENNGKTLHGKVLYPEDLISGSEAPTKHTIEIFVSQNKVEEKILTTYWK